MHSEMNAGSAMLNNDVHAIAASLSNAIRVGTGASAFPEQTESTGPTSPVILQRRASRGLQSRLSDEQTPRPFKNEDGLLVIEQRLDHLDARLDSISRSVEFSEAFLSLKLKQQLQEILGGSAAARAGGRTSGSPGSWQFVFLLICATGSAALLGAEIHSDSASRAAGWALERVATLLAVAAQTLPG